jgi:hypothetical protein
MAVKYETYENVREKMQPGDVIAFSGKGGFSEIIKWATRSAVSHVAAVFQAHVPDAGAIRGDFFNQVIESNLSRDAIGVSLAMLSDRVASYDGFIWWLPLSPATRKKMDLPGFLEFCLRQERKPYDVPQAVKSAIDFMDSRLPAGMLSHNREDFEKFFCSELIAAALEHSKAIPRLNSSEVTPVDLCMFKIYSDEYVQIKGEVTEIVGFNTLDSKGWGE